MNWGLNYFRRLYYWMARVKLYGKISTFTFNWAANQYGRPAANSLSAHLTAELCIICFKGHFKYAI